MIAGKICTVLASDYYYPAPLLAAFRLAADAVTPLANAWALVSERPAAALGLADRGAIATGRRADLILVEATDARRPIVAATIARGRIVYLADAHRLRC
jgi:alpha-D-ribose 1-methylphosphonate 5-triphosphate diphosphatase